MVIKCCSKLKFSIQKYQIIYDDNAVKLFLGVQCLLMNIVSYSSNVLTGKNFDVCLQVNQHAPASSDERKNRVHFKSLLYFFRFTSFFEGLHAGYISQQNAETRKDWFIRNSVHEKRNPCKLFNPVEFNPFLNLTL